MKTNEDAINVRVGWAIIIAVIAAIAQVFGYTSSAVFLIVIVHLLILIVAILLEMARLMAGKA